MSKKNKARRRPAAAQAGAGRPAPSAQAAAGQAAAGQAAAPTRPRSQMDQQADEIVKQVLSSLWEGVASGDLLRAELETATRTARRCSGCS